MIKSAMRERLSFITGLFNQDKTSKPIAFLFIKKVISKLNSVSKLKMNHLLYLPNILHQIFIFDAAMTAKINVFNFDFWKM